MSCDIFLSYKSEDKLIAQKIAEALERQGYSVWWDPVIPPGRRFDEVIQDELDTAQCVIVLWSKGSVKSRWVNTEASEGDKRGILIPVLIDNVLPPLAFRLIEAANLINWDGTSNHPEFDLLLKTVSGIVGSSEAVKTNIQKPSIEEEMSTLQKYADQITENIMSGMNENNYSKFSRYFDKITKNAMSEKIFNEESAEIKSLIGNYTSKEFLEVELQNQYKIFYYIARFTKETENVIIKVVFQNIEGKVKVSGLWLDSPKLREK